MFLLPEHVFPLSWLHYGALMAPGETLLLLTHGRAPVATGYMSQHKSSKNWECSQTIPSQIPHPQLGSEGPPFLFSNTFYFSYFLLHLSWLSMQCMCEQWVIINVSPWSVYLSLAVKSTTPSIAWVKEPKLWITRELNVNLYVKQRLNFFFFKKSKMAWEEKCICIFFCSYMAAVILVLYLNNKSNWSIKLIIFHWPPYSF